MRSTTSPRSTRGSAAGRASWRRWRNERIAVLRIGCLMALAPAPSLTWTFVAGEWHEGNIPLMGARTHAAWLGSSVFDGARAFEGVTPDLHLHCARVNESAKALFLKPLVSPDQWLELVAEGLKRFDRNAALYIRPMYW